MTTTQAFKPLSKNDLADILGVSIRTVENWVGDQTLPAPSKLGNRVYWHPNTFYTWLDWRLSTGVSAAENTQATPTPHAKPAKAKPRLQQGPAKNELEKMRNRTEAQLEKLMA